MSLPYTDLTKSPAQKNLIEVRGDGNDLQPFLEIHPPDIASTTPPILAFTRKREIEIPWDDIISDESVANAGSEVIAATREYFEKSWGFEPNEEWWNDKNHHLLDPEPENRSWYIRQIEKTPGITIFYPDFDNLDKDEPTATPITEGFIIRHGTSGRLYLLDNPQKTLSGEYFTSFEKYESAWQEIDGVKLVFESEADAQSFYMEFKEIDLRPVLIQRKFEELNILFEFADKVSTNISAATDKMIEQITTTTFDPDEIEQLQRKVLRMDIGKYDAQSRIERLASDAARLGYLLITEKGGRKVTLPGMPDNTLEQGKLYSTYKRTARWTEYVSKYVQVWVGWWIFKHMETREIKFPRPMEQVVVDYQVVDTSKDILEETRTGYIKDGRHVYVFEQTPSGLFSTEGVSLRQIMDHCKYDEAFRRACVVMLPVYEDSLTGQRLVAKYAIYERPLPGMVPTIIPRLSLEESLTYRTAWAKMQLGELLSSINLAPDEERKVTITKRFEQETTVARTSTSIFDISRADTTDLATEMENQTRQEQESSKSLQFSTKASGGWGAFSAEASASGGTSSSLKNMSQAISKVASKAAKSVNSQNREEVSSTTTARTTISNAEETVATIRNINQGRSLNLMFYRLYNKYSGGLFLEGLRFDVIPSVEVIAGSGVYESKSYSLEELPRLFNEFKAARLPFAVKDDATYTDRLLESIDTLLKSEYEPPMPAAANAEAASVSVARVSLPPPEVLPIRPQAGQTGADSKLAELSEKLRRASILSDDPIAPQELLVAASGMYLDAAVGAQPSTEPYSERMREQMVALKTAEAALTRAEARYRDSLAQHLVQDGGNWIIAITPYRESNTLVFTLKFPLAAGKWDFERDGKKQSEVPVEQIGNYTVNLRWNNHQTWLDDDGLLKHRLELHDREKGIILRRV